MSRFRGTDWLWAPLVIAVAVVFAVWDAWRDYDEAVEQTYDRIGALTRVVEARTTQTFQAIDELLQDTAEELGDADVPGDPDLHRYLVARSRIRAEALTVTVVGADGVIRHSTIAELVGKQVGGRSYLSHFQANPGDANLFIGEPVTALMNRKVVFAARALRHGDGSLRAVVVSAIAPEIFGAMLDSAVPKESSGAISLSGSSHVILARYPGGEAVGQSLADSPLMKAHLANGGTESRLDGIGGVDGLRRLIAVRTVAPYGITVGVSVARSDVIEPVWRGMAGSAVALGGVSLITVVMLRHGRGRERARAEAEQRVIRARDHYIRILDDFPALIRRTGPAGICDYVNRTWLDFTGRERSAEIGEGWIARVHPDDRAAVCDGKAAECEYRLQRADGSYRWLHEIRRGFVDVDGATVGTLAACVDITEARLYQQQLQHSNEELEQFAYVASHDLREPLRMISSYISLVERRLQPEPGSDICEFLDFAKDGANRMDRLVLDLLQFSRIGRMSAPIAPVDSGRALDTALGQLRLAIDESAATVEASELPVVQASEDDVVRLFQNLVGNAIKYARPGEPPRIAVSARRDGPLWEFAVADNGIGIDPHYHDRVFRIFQRLHPRDAHGGGSGIGLAICKKIVERHSGRIWVESDGGGHGATFRFTLPGAFTSS